MRLSIKDEYGGFYKYLFDSFCDLSKIPLFAKLQFYISKENHITWENILQGLM